MFLRHCRGYFKEFHFQRKFFLVKMHVEGDKYNTGALVQKYEAGIKGFFKDEDLVSLVMKVIFFN